MRLALVLCGLLLAACTGEGPVALSPQAPAASPAPAARVTPPTPVSLALSRQYRRLEADLLTRGLLRTDGGGPDTMFAQGELVENFIRIALFDEHVGGAASLVRSGAPSRLRRWSGPVRIGLEFGPSVPEAVRARDRETVRSYAARLAAATGHPISVGGPANFHVLVLREDERRAIGPRLQQLIPGISPGSVRTIETLPPSVLCVALAFAGGPSVSDYTQAVAVIPAEHPDLMRLSCYHEEIAQGLGLANDSPEARPSIFNDDEEFATLTRHDELLLGILYDDRLRPGMTPSQARPVVEVVAAERLGGGS